MNAFIFQATVDRYNLQSELKAGGRETWLATRYRHAMRPGDVVYFWNAGPESVRGLYGWGRIVRKPRRSSGTDVVDVKVKRVFSSPLLVKDIRQDSVLSRLLILRVPQGGNFLLSPAEANRLASVVRRHSEIAPEQRVFGRQRTNPSVTRRDRIFIAYSHADKEWLFRLEVHLAPLAKKHRHLLWDDTKIAPGEKWKVEIARAMGSAKVAVLLVSADFLASEFIIENELPALLDAAADQGAVILPVIAAPCRFRETASLSQFQAVNATSKPLSAMSTHEREDMFYQVSVAVEGALATSKRSHD